MRILVIPSWLPHRCYPLEGQYVLDQATAIGELRPSWRVAIASWNQGQNHLSLGHLWKSPGCLWNALADRGWSERSLVENVRQFTRPALSWNDGLGNRNGLLQANREILTRAGDWLSGIDLIHAHVSFPAGWVAMHLSRETKIPYLVTEHMGPFPLPVYQRPDGTLLEILREPLERADA